MAKVNVQRVTLSGYKATVDGALYLVLGTWDSYGTEQLQISAGPEWDGLVIKATFVTPAGATPVVVPDGGLIDVPPEATAQALTAGSPGMIVFSGVTSGVQRISCNLLYLVRDHAKIDGTAPEPTPDQWAQLIEKYQEMLNAAVPPNGPPGYVLGATENGNAWVPQTGGGADGGYYAPGIKQTEPGTANFSWTASKAGMPTVPGVRLTLPPGQDGENGVTPTIGENGNWYLGEADTGKPSRGKPGPAYELTPEDKQAIVQDVLAVLPNAEGVGF